MDFVNDTDADFYPYADVSFIFADGGSVEPVYFYYKIKVTTSGDCGTFTFVSVIAIPFAEINNYYLNGIFVEKTREGEYCCEDKIENVECDFHVANIGEAYSGIVNEVRVSGHSEHAASRLSFNVNPVSTMLLNKDKFPDFYNIYNAIEPFECKLVYNYYIIFIIM